MIKQILIVLALCALCYFVLGVRVKDDNAVNSKSVEHMAPLNYATYENKYPRGECNAGSFKRTPCMVGNCPLESNISNDEFCKIQCAQDPDPKSREDCYRYCMDMMDGGCR